MTGLHRSHPIVHYCLRSSLIMPRLTFSRLIMIACDLNHWIMHKCPWTVHRLCDRSTRPLWTGQHPAVHGGPCRELGLGACARWSNLHVHPCWASSCAGPHASVEPDCAAAGLHRLVHRATCFRLLSYVSSSSELRLDCS